MDLTLHVWRQASASDEGRFVTYPAPGVSPDMSFLEMLDVVNEGLARQSKDGIAFDSDCREGICGMCSLVVNGVAHGPDRDRRNMYAEIDKTMGRECQESEQPAEKQTGLGSIDNTAISLDDGDKWPRHHQKSKQ